MNASNVPDKYCNILAQILSVDDGTIHFLWDCIEEKVIALGAPFIPENVPDPLEWIKESGLISESSADVFNVYASQIESGIISGAEKCTVGVDVEMKLTPDGNPLMYHFTTDMLLDDDRKVTAVHINIRPFSSREVYNKQIIENYTSDKNPKLFAQRCARMLNKHPDDKVAFVQFDVERFKLINEKYGVEIGDELLKFINDSLGVICTEDIPYARLTADVFMFVIAFEQESDVEDFIRKIESMITGYKGMEYRLIFGVAIAEDRTLHTRRHGDNASLVRQMIHGNALNNIGWYNSKMKMELFLQQNIEDDMHKALLNDEFLMYLQPKYSISNEKIIGAEALARWVHPHKGMISPAEFIPVFEKNGFILVLDKFIWEQACKEIRLWIDSGIEPVPISVNISRQYIQSFDVVEYIKGLVKKYDIPTRLIELEITETIDSEATEEIVAKLKNEGFKMLMDDFGCGYSSLNMLKTTQFDVLKMDRSFLSEFMDSDRGRKIIEHTISMSKDIGIEIIAEGVETREQAQFLSSCGCNEAQGFYYSKPISKKEFMDKLSKECGK